MRYKKVDIKYWAHPNGDDFQGLPNLFNEIDGDYVLSFNKKRIDGLGAGIYDLIINITEDISLLDLAKSYTEDGLKLAIGYSLKPLFKSLNTLFKSNKELKPSIEKLSIDYKDCRINLYNVYPKGIEDSMDDLIKELVEFRLSNKSLFKKIKTIHIPIYNEKDWYKICDFRVKLEVDEPIINFSKEDYFKYWGIKTKDGKCIYDVKNKKIIEKNFYTQKSYDKLFNKAFEEGKID